MVRLRPVSVVCLERVYREVFLKNEKFQKKGGILSFFHKLFAFCGMIVQCSKQFLKGRTKDGIGCKKFSI